MIHPSKVTFEPTPISSMQSYILSAIHLDFYQLEMLILHNMADVGGVHASQSTAVHSSKTITVHEYHHGCQQEEQIIISSLSPPALDNLSLPAYNSCSKLFWRRKAITVCVLKLRFQPYLTRLIFTSLSLSTYYTFTADYFIWYSFDQHVAVVTSGRKYWCSDLNSHYILFGCNTQSFWFGKDAVDSGLGAQKLANKCELLILLTR